MHPTRSLYINDNVVWRRDSVFFPGARPAGHKKVTRAPRHGFLASTTNYDEENERRCVSVTRARRWEALISTFRRCSSYLPGLSIWWTSRSHVQFVCSGSAPSMATMVSAAVCIAILRKSHAASAKLLLADINPLPPPPPTPLCIVGRSFFPGISFKKSAFVIYDQHSCRTHTHTRGSFYLLIVFIKSCIYLRCACRKNVC